MLAKKAVYTISFSSLLVLGFQNCSQTKFSAAKVDALQKASTISTQSMFEDSQLSINGADGGVDTSPIKGIIPTIDGDDGGIKYIPSQSNNVVNGSDGGNSNSPMTGADGGATSSPIAGADGGATTTVNPGMVDVEAQYMCNWASAKETGATLKTAQNMVLTIKDDMGGEVCSIPGNTVVSQLLAKKSFSVPICAQMKNSNGSLKIGNYTLLLRSPNAPIVDANGIKALMQMPFEVKSDSVSIAGSGLVLFDTNKVKEAAMNNQSVLSVANDPKCDTVSSPLVINFSRAPIRLSSVLRGIEFDILGANSYPMAHDTKKISWVKSSRVMFLAKPNAQGLVTGVDELFGDNTQDENGKFATDGFAALAKHDSDKDGYIDADDKVFSELRLWSDVDRDGISRADELYTLEELGVEVIDLSYDPSYSEQDRHGNLIKYKSVVKMKDQSLLPMFDIWFRYQ